VFHDQVGLPVLIEDGGGTEVWRAASVEPYGTIAVAPGHLVDYNLRFPGHYYDPETGLHYNRFRSYSPALGRYLQSDPAGQSGGTNLYAYVPNPLTDVDVLGLAPSHKGNNSNGEKPKASGRQMEEVDDEYEEVMVTNSAGVMVTRTYVQEKDELFEVACAAAGGYLGPPEWTKYKDSYYRNEDNSRVIEWNEQGHQNTKEGPHVKVMDYNPDRNKHEVQSKTFVQDWDEYKPSPAYWKRQNQRYQDAADQDPQGPSHGDAPPPGGKTGEGDND
jgi:RHS repeat-associated protein